MSPPRLALASLAAVTFVCGISPARAGEDMTIAAVSAASLHTPETGGDMRRFGSGGAMSLLYLMDEGNDELSGGFAAETTFLFGDDGERLYDLGISLVASSEIADHAPALWLELGLDLGHAVIADGEAVGRGTMVGLHGAAGIHGLLTDTIYGRATVGYVGTGIGGVRTALALGWRL